MPFDTAPVIQTIPQGLLGLLQLKQQGSNPALLSGQVVPIVDLMPLWLNRQIIDLTVSLTGASTVSVAVPTAGASTYNVTGMQVPPQETWWVDEFTVGCSLLAAEYIRFAPGAFLPVGGAPFTYAPDYNDAVTARARTARVTARGFWMLPGTQPLIVVYDSLTAANISVSAALRGVRVPI